ncbi:MAG: methyltransferase [Xanthomonadales bacterium]|nr:methyltransferase [Xanthomonadales bacterium]
MERVSEVILRQLPQLAPGVVHLVNPPADGLFRELLADDRKVGISTGSRGDFQRLLAMGANVRFEAFPLVIEPADCIILVLPREKQKLAMLLHAVSGQLAPRGRLWLVGANRSGIKSSPAMLRHVFKNVVKKDSARHCSLFEAWDAQALEPFNSGDYETRWPLQTATGSLEMVSLPGVFAHGRLDPGTGLLLDVLQDLQPSGRILDFASGCGVIGLSILAADDKAGLTLLDDSALAIEAGARSLQANGLTARLLPSDGLSEADGAFDWIISNPPFHRGVDNDFDIAASFFRDAGTFLSEKGRIVIVFNRHLPYTGWLRNHFKSVNCLAQNRAFIVIQASKTK